jgi:hypothetical protein
MESIERVGKRFEVAGRNLLEWTMPLAARIWITVLILFR